MTQRVRASVGLHLAADTADGLAMQARARQMFQDARSPAEERTDMLRWVAGVAVRPLVAQKISRNGVTWLIERSRLNIQRMELRNA